MSQSVNRYKADLRDTRFLLFEQFGLGEILAADKFKDWDIDDASMILGEVYKWACERLGPLNAAGDRQGCKLVDGRVQVPDGFKKAWDDIFEMQWLGLDGDSEYGGAEGPFALRIAASEYLMGANPAFMMYPGLSEGVARVIEKCGTLEQKKTFIPKITSGTYSGTMCLTETDAGSDVGANTTRATSIGDGKYKIEGTKIFISCGDHTLSENIIHLVLARTPGAPAGTRGLSLFLVPRDKLDGTGSNHVVTGSIEHKMGINASVTCVLNFGEGGDCVGELVGAEEGQGIKQMFLLMNSARIDVGLQGLAVAAGAYLAALDYAKERKQGASFKEWKDPNAAKVAIIQHPDVRRMLLDMKSKVEGLRALSVKLTTHIDRAAIAQGKDDDAATYHRGQVDLLVPLLKAYGSDQSFEICATAIQVFGGAGFLQDHPVEQACRDSKIFSIYEGTNHIQALDLVGRKLGQRGGANFQAFMKDVTVFVTTHKQHPEFGAQAAALATAVESLGGTAMRFLGWFRDADKAEQVPLHANRFQEMMSVTTVAWLLLDAAVIADGKLAELSESDRDHAFYSGKKAAALYYANTVLPTVPANAAVIAAEERTPLDISDAAFASV